MQVNIFCFYSFLTTLGNFQFKSHLKPAGNSGNKLGSLLAFASISATLRSLSALNHSCTSSKLGFSHQSPSSDGKIHKTLSKSTVPNLSPQVQVSPASWDSLSKYCIWGLWVWSQSLWSSRGLSLRVISKAFWSSKSLAVLGFSAVTNCPDSNKFFS